MIKRCRECSTLIDSGLKCDTCYKFNIVELKTSEQKKEIENEVLIKHAPLLEKLSEVKKTMTLPTDSNERKNYPILSGCIKYFPAALAGVSKVSKAGNDKHNPGEPLHHARGKSTDHADCIVRHLIDVQDLIAGDERSALTPKGVEDLLTEVSSLAWRALAYSQELHEKFGKVPLAPGAKKENA